MAGVDLALLCGTVYASPAQPPLPNTTILVDAGTIIAVGADPEDICADALLDCSGLTVTAGFWNSHVHFFERKWADAATIPDAELGAQLQDFTRFGFTNVFDLSSRWVNTRALRDRIESGDVPGPGVRSTGEGLVPIGGLPPPDVLRAQGIMTTPLPEIGNAAQAEAAANELLAQGVDALKLFLSSQQGKRLDREAILLAVRAAHRLGKPVFAHPNDGADALEALRCGVDVIAHTTPRSGPWDAAILSAMRERDAALTPTLSLWDRSMRHDRVSARDSLVDTALGQLASWLASGGTVLFGTDLGAVDPDPAQEYGLMAQAGASIAQILSSLTTAPAQRFGAPGQHATIAAGQAADLVVLDGDPSKNLDSLTSVRYTLRAGKVVYRAS